MIRFIVLILGLQVVSVFPLAAQPQTPLRFPAEVDDTYALSSNLAGLGFIYGSEFRVSHAWSTEPSSDFDRALGLYAATNLFSHLTLGVAYHHEWYKNDDTHTWILGSALRMGKFALGFGRAYETLTDMQADNWRLGFSWRPLRWAAIGLHITDLADELTRRTWNIGMAVRPWPNRLELAAQWRIPENEDITEGKPDIAGILNWHPMDGVTLGFGADLRGKLQAQLSVDFGYSSSQVWFGDIDRSTSIGLDVALHGYKKKSVGANEAVVLVKLDGNLSTGSDVNWISGVVESGHFGDILFDLKRASQDPRLKGLVVRIGGLKIGWAKAAELRDILKEINNNGQRVDCYLAADSELEYYIASGCTTIALSPIAILSVDGIAISSLYFADGLEKIGVEVEVVRAGKYKSAPESYTRSSISPEAKRAVDDWMDDVYSQILLGIAKGRKVDPEVVEGWINRGVVTSTEALSLNMVDSLTRPEDVDLLLQNIYGADVRWTPLDRFLAPDIKEAWGTRQYLAVVHIDGIIVSGRNRKPVFNSDLSIGSVDVVRTLDMLRKQHRIAAVVLRVDSPGGDPFASDDIARAVKRLAAVKPVVASLGDVAASGGYYVAALATEIWAQEATLTGSIGVFSLKTNLAGLLEKLGIGHSIINRGLLSGQQSIYSKRSKAGQAAIQRAIDAMYLRFKSVVSQGRKLDMSTVEQIAQGRIWSGQDALNHGLVDSIGSFQSALQRAAQLAGYDSESSLRLYVVPTKHRGILSQLPDMLGKQKEPDVWVLFSKTPLIKRLVAQWFLMSDVSPVAMLPFVFEPL